MHLESYGRSGRRGCSYLGGWLKSFNFTRRLFGSEAEGDVENEEVEKVAVIENVAQRRRAVQLVVPENARNGEQVERNHQHCETRYAAKPREHPIIKSR